MRTSLEPAKQQLLLPGTGSFFPKLKDGNINKAVSSHQKSRLKLHGAPSSKLLNVPVIMLKAKFNSKFEDLVGIIKQFLDQAVSRLATRRVF